MNASKKRRTLNRIKEDVASLLQKRSKSQDRKKEDVGGLKKYKTTNRIKWMGERIKI